MAVHYPADLEIFALVCIDDHNAGAAIDPGVKRLVRDKLQKFCSHWPEFRATSEDIKTLTAMLDLEQYLGREIVWVRGMGWEEMIRKKKMLPNIQMRFCTSIMKIAPIFEHVHLYYDSPVKMRIGYRYDEPERVERASEVFKFPRQYDIFAGRHRWESVKWRVNDFPMVQDKVLPHHVRDFWADKGIDFPLDSNCQNCFWKQPEQLRKNFDTSPQIMWWAAVQEDIIGGTLRKDMSLLQINKLALQLDFHFGTGAGCQASGCTD